LKKMRKYPSLPATGGITKEHQGEVFYDVQKGNLKI
jgi:hypothetical protein